LVERRVIYFEEWNITDFMPKLPTPANLPQCFHAEIEPHPDLKRYKRSREERWNFGAAKFLREALDLAFMLIALDRSPEAE
jgi:hypothetical protein